MTTGRPVLADNEKARNQIRAYLDDEEYEKLYTLARSLNRSVSNIIRVAVGTYVDQQSPR